MMRIKNLGLQPHFACLQLPQAAGVLRTPIPATVLIVAITGISTFRRFSLPALESRMLA
jgi:hypothetical protein